MYLHCKRGFVEADRWDGAAIPDEVQQREARRLKRQGGTTIIARSRDAVTLVALLGDVGITAELFHTPDWDYPFRVYLTVDQWAQVLAAVAFGLDYRNFKKWTKTARNALEHELAHRIWQAAFDASDKPSILEVPHDRDHRRRDDLQHREADVVVDAKRTSDGAPERRPRVDAGHPRRQPRR